VALTPEPPMTPTDPKFMLLAETIVQALVIVICTVKVVVTVAPCPAAGVNITTTVTVVIDSHRTSFVTLGVSNPGITDQLVATVHDAACVPNPKGNSLQRALTFVVNRACWALCCARMACVELMTRSDFILIRAAPASRCAPSICGTLVCLCVAMTTSAIREKNQRQADHRERDGKRRPHDHDKAHAPG
jgi:hypothetical protein